MTLAELAKMSELTAGYISQLERNLASPSIPALLNIARSLCVTIQWFSASETQTAPVWESGDVEAVVIWVVTPPMF